MKCPHCGFLNSDQAQACANCERSLWQRQPEHKFISENTASENKSTGSNSSTTSPSGWPAVPNPGSGGVRTGQAFQSSYSNPSAANSGQYYSSENAQNFDYQAKTVTSKRERTNLRGVARAGTWLVDALMIGLFGLLAVGLPILIWFFNLAGNYFQELTLACTFSGETNSGCLNTLGAILFTRQEFGNLLGLLLLFGLLAAAIILFYLFGLVKRGKSVGQRLFANKAWGRISRPSTYDPPAWDNLFGGRLAVYRDKIMALLGYRPKKL